MRSIGGVLTVIIRTFPQLFNNFIKFLSIIPEHYDINIVFSSYNVRYGYHPYIQETLKGIDVSCVFVKRDNEYYDFKPEIQIKAQIADYLEIKEQPIIDQFEKWWDKYQVPLNEIDRRVKKSEEVMWKYLKEIGYE